MFIPDFSEIQPLSISEFQALSSIDKSLIETKKSFTETLEKIINQPIKIKRLNTYESEKLHPFEKEFNALSNRFYCREVVFLADDKPIGFARSALCVSKIGDFEKQIMALKNQSMGAYIYSLNFKRSGFVGLTLQSSESEFIGRSSVYSSGTSQLMISEIWKNDLDFAY